MNSGMMLRQPTAYLPPAMSLAALITLGAHVALVGVAREADEGAAAHLWQLLMVAQVPLVAWFGIKWLPRAPRQALPILALQAIAALVALVPVLLLGL